MHQITATFAVSCTGEILLIQLIYAGKTEGGLPKYSFPRSFSVTFTENHWSNTEKSDFSLLGRHQTKQKLPVRATCLDNYGHL